MPERPWDPATDSTLASVPGVPPAGASAALRPGTIVAETYQVTRLLGQGGMGAVWEAKHLRLPDKRVVVKVLLFGTTDAVTLARFRREADIASRVTRTSSRSSTSTRFRTGRRSSCSSSCRANRWRPGWRAYVRRSRRRCRS